MILLSFFIITKTPPAYVQDWRGYFLWWKLATGINEPWKNRSLFPVRRWINKLTRSSFDNMVLLIAKNFQLVKFSQVDFPIKNPASLRLRMTGQAGTPSGHHFHNETCQKELALIEGLLSPRQRNETEMLSIQKKPAPAEAGAMLRLLPLRSSYSA